MSYLVKELEAVLTGQLALFKIMLSLFKKEAELAKLSLFPLILNLFILFIILCSTWLTFMFFFGVFDDALLRFAFLYLSVSYDSQFHITRYLFTLFIVSP